MSALSLTAAPWRSLRWLVLAPHPDDETLGAGALIAQAARSGHLAGLIYLTDGAGSHASASPALVASRAREAATALHRLTGNRALAPVHLDWPDGAPAGEGDPVFDRTARRLASLCRQWRVDALAVTALHEPHCDHAAAARLAYAVQKRVKRALVVAEYLVWADAPAPRPRRTFRTAAMATGRRRHALRAHRSQLTASLGPGFRLARDRLRMPGSDILYVRRPA